MRTAEPHAAAVGHLGARRRTGRALPSPAGLPLVVAAGPWFDGFTTHWSSATGDSIETVEWVETFEYACE